MKRTRVRLEISAFMMLCVFTLSILSINAWALRQLAINSGVNIVYNAPMFEALTVFQPINQSDPSWTKIGYNATLNANAVKVESNSLSELAGMLTDENQDGNPDGVTYTEDDYYTAPVYRKIDNVNVDINTGEIIGKLSDPDYPFEWYGRQVTLPSGYTLASGRVLTEEETFRVDVYTYYPEMYVLRYVQDNVQYISIAETPEAFEDENISMPEGITPVYVKEWYTATFEATIFNPDRSVAQNEYGIIPRSYVYDYTPLTSGSVKYLQDYYNFEKVDGTVASSNTYGGQNLSANDASNNSTNQNQMLTWANNLTLAWETSSLNSAYRTATGVQGENYTAFIYNLLYLVKYANNNSQATIGYGNTYTYGRYNASGTTVTSESGATITTGRESDDVTHDAESIYESEKGGGTIGVYNANEKGTATYNEINGTYRLSQNGYNGAGMNYGYNSTYTYKDDPEGLYNNQFLTESLTTSSGEKRVLRDGYVGSDKYTSVFCLGQANPWGNIFTWVFGTAVISDGVDLWMYVNFNDYDYGTIDTWLTDTQSGYENNASRLTSHNYMRLSYVLPAVGGYYRYLGTSVVTSDTGIESLIGMPSGESGTASFSTGLCDNYYCNNSTLYTFGILHGADINDTYHAGALCFAVDNSLSYIHACFGFRSMLILS